MDLAMIIGVIGAFAAVLSMVFIEGQSVTSLMLPGPMILVFGATIAIGLAGATVPDAIRAYKTIPKAIRGKKPDFQATIDTLVDFTDKARRNGLLSLDGATEKLDDQFMKTALRLVADGKDSEDLTDLLEAEIATRTHAEKTSSKFFAAMGGYAPTVGIIGTVVSLAHVLENLSSPDKLGPMIASAFIATLWGLLSANFIWLPLGTRLHRLAELESERMHLVLEGVLAIQTGTPARELSERLAVMVPGSKTAGKKNAKDAEPTKESTSE